MAMQSRTVIGGAAALAIVGVGLWVSTVALSPPAQRATVEIQPVRDEKSWAVEVKELGPTEKTTSR